MRHRLLGAVIVGVLLLIPLGGFAGNLSVRSATTLSPTTGKPMYYIPVCGNGIPDPGEACDDGKQCANGTQCTTVSDCYSSQWDTQKVGEECKTRDWDGCSSDCMTRSYLYQARVCGNGVIESGETCDPPNGTNCGSNCQHTYSVSVVPSQGLVVKNDGGILYPHSSECGDGVKESDEGCDDGNTVSGDGCSATCTDETPGAVCGNGVLEAGEGCEDGNAVSGDGCSASCTVEPPPVCGNGILEAGEECDDGNNVGGDSCKPNCKK